MTLSLTAEQIHNTTLAIDGSGHMSIEARAGSGKTFQLQLIHRALPPTITRQIIYFGKANADEAQSKGLPARTSHSIGMEMCRENLSNRVKVNKYKWYNILEKTINDLDEEDRPKLKDAVRLVSYLYELQIGTGCSDSIIADHAASLGIPPLPAAFIQNAFQQSINLAITRGELYFSDMLVLPVLFQWPYRTHLDLLCVDEAQDTAQLQREFYKLIGAERTIGVGDPYQSLYAFRGADTNAFELFKEEFPGSSGTLTMSFRCAKAGIREAQTLVPDIMAMPNAPEGIVAEKPLTISALRPGDVILCRNNRPLVSLALQALRQGKRVTIRGKDYAEHLLRIIKELPGTTAAEKLSHFDAQKSHTLSKIPARTRSMVEDRWDAVQALLEDNLSDPARIIALFSDEDCTDIPILSTIHKAKGLEWKRVWLIHRELLDLSDQQDLNALYVAITRMREEFYYATN